MEGLITGRVVHYVLSDGDVSEIRRRREGRMKDGLTFSGFQGNSVEVGQHVPAMVVCVFDTPGDLQAPGMVNLTCFLDGHDTHWATSRKYGLDGEPLTWHWIERDDDANEDRIAGARGSDVAA
ncbi:hypothetical protein LCGC14_2180750 [marine sediment metagenome]|uniref:Uncharacterized protein n=1 Tax=marine sediment metagenome TaxID=412755 RepID=A0A0F9GIA3_9ZZZZ